MVSMAYDQETAERVRKVLSVRRDVVERKMMGGLCFMVGGNMCCSASGRGGLLVRVNKAAHARMLAEPHVQPMQMGARTMQGFVRVLPEGYRTDAALKKWVGRGVEAVAELPPKPVRAAARKAAGRRKS
jgi:TfoX/Sxy family transcriptional regulator of competence genes